MLAVNDSHFSSITAYSLKLREVKFFICTCLCMLGREIYFIFNLLFFVGGFVVYGFLCVRVGERACGKA